MKTHPSIGQPGVNQLEQVYRIMKKGMVLAHRSDTLVDMIALFRDSREAVNASSRLNEMGIAAQVVEERKVSFVHNFSPADIEALQNSTSNQLRKLCTEG